MENARKRMESHGFSENKIKVILEYYGDDKEGLESYLRFVEMLIDDRKQYPKEDDYEF